MRNEMHIWYATAIKMMYLLFDFGGAQRRTQQNRRYYDLFLVALRIDEWLCDSPSCLPLLTVAALIDFEVYAFEV